MKRPSNAATNAVTGIPLIDKLRTVAEVLAAHAAHGKLYRPLELSESWKVLGQLVGQQSAEQHRLRTYPLLLTPLMRATVQSMPDFRASQVATAARGLAQLHEVTDNALWRPTPALWSALAARGAEVVAEFTLADLVSTAEAVAKTARPAPELMRALAAEATWRVSWFQMPPGLLGGAAPLACLVPPRAPAAPPHLRAPPEHLGGLPWAQELAPQAAPKWSTFRFQTTRRVGELRPQQVAALARAYAAPEAHAPALLGALAGEATRRARDFAPRQLASVAWALQLWWKRPSTLPEVAAPSASLDHLRPWGSPIYPGAQPEPLGGSAWPE